MIRVAAKSKTGIKFLATNADNPWPVTRLRGWFSVGE
jgi:hypothetical protein